MQMFGGMLNPREKIVSNLKELTRCCEFNKASGQKIVLTSGCFDLLHGGHLEYICDAGSLGFLVVGINSNQFVKRLKGESRPVRDQDDRAFLIAGFSPVKLVAIFDSDYDLIKAVSPDIYVASSSSHVLVGQDHLRLSLLNKIGSKIIEMDSKKEDSTTDIIRRASG